MEPTLNEVKQNLEKCKTDIHFFGELFQMNRALGSTAEFSPKQCELFDCVNRRDKHIVCIWSRQTGKSTSFGIIVAWWLLFGKNEHIIVLAPTEGQATEMYDKISRAIGMHDFFMSYIKKMNSERIEAHNGNRVSFMSASPGSHIRGKTATRIVIDETEEVTDEKYYGDIMPFVTSMRDRDFTILEAGTPKQRNHFYITISSPTVSVIRQVWHECPFINKDFVIKQKEKTPIQLWEQEFLCKFPEEGFSVFPEKWFFKEKRKEIKLTEVDILHDYHVWHDIKDLAEIADEIKKELTRGAIYVMGYDQGRQMDNAALVIWRVDRFPCTIFYSKMFPLGTTNPMIVKEMKYLVELCDIDEINIDWTGEKGFKDFLDEAGISVPLVKYKSSSHKGVQQNIASFQRYKKGLIVFNTETKTQMVTKVQALIQKGLIRIPTKDEVLFQQFLQQQYEVSSNNKFKYYHPSNAHDDMLWATLLALKNVDFDLSDGEDKIEFVNVWKDYHKKVGYRENIMESFTVKNSKFDTKLGRHDRFIH